jgi:SHS2 domain-containing protein
MSHDETNGPIQVVEHTADWALQIRGRDLAELLHHAAQGLAGLLTGDLPVGTDEERTVRIDAYDTEGLLVGWLSELVYWAERDGLVFRDIDIREMTPTALAAIVRGSRVENLQKHIKAVTYHDLAIRSAGEGLEVTIVFDV